MSRRIVPGPSPTRGDGASRRGGRRGNVNDPKTTRKPVTAPTDAWQAPLQNRSHCNLSSSDDQNTAGLSSGALGPGAEPPVAVAARAFAHENTSTNRDILDDQGVKEGMCSSQEPAEGEKHSNNGWDLNFDRRGECGVEVADLTDHTLPFAGDVSIYATTAVKPAIIERHADSQSTNNEEEAETLQDSFNLSDEVGPEGASTGRGGDPFPRFFETHPTCVNNSKSVYSSSDSSSDSSSEASKNPSERDYRQRGNERHFEERFSSRSPPRRQRLVGRGHHGSVSGQRRLFLLNGNTRVSPSEFDDKTIVESEDGRRRHAGRNRSRRHKSPPRRDRSAKKGGSGRQQRAKKRRSRPLLTDSQTGCDVREGADECFDSEMARLRRENNAIKQQQDYSRYRQCSEAGG